MADYVVDASVILKWILGDREEPDPVYTWTWTLTAG